MNRTRRTTAGVLCAISVIATCCGAARAGADFDYSGLVDLDDYVTWRTGLGEFPIGGDGDANGDWEVDIADFVVVKRQFGTNGTAPVPVGASGVQDMILFVDESGEASLKNISSHIVEFDGYQISDSTGQLDVDAWTPLNDWWDVWNIVQPCPYVVDPITADFDAVSFESALLCEGAIAGIQQIHPGDSFRLGAIAPVDWQTLSFVYTNSEAPGSGVFASQVIPEPAAMTLLALGALAGLRRKRLGPEPH